MSETLCHSALRLAEAFIAEELEVRKSSYLPNPTDDEQADIVEAQVVLAAVRDALTAKALDDQERGL